MRMTPEERQSLIAELIRHENEQKIGFLEEVFDIACMITFADTETERTANVARLRLMILEADEHGLI